MLLAKGWLVCEYSHMLRYCWHSAEFLWVSVTGASKRMQNDQVYLLTGHCNMVRMGSTAQQRLGYG
jgi:hypothetical protein